MFESASDLPPATEPMGRVASRAVEQWIEDHATGTPIDVSGYPRVEHLPEHLSEAAAEAVRDPRTGPILGLDSLRDSLADRGRLENAAITPDHIAVTNGAMSALSLIWMTLGTEGSTVLVPTPTYFVDGAIRLAGRRVRFCDSIGPDGTDWERLGRAVDTSTTVIYFSNPNNPRGTVWDHHDLDELVRLLATFPQLHAVVDESYMTLTYDGIEFVGSPQIAHDRVLTVRSMSKSWGLPWLRVGWIVADPSLTEKMIAPLEWSQLYGNWLGQQVALAAIEGDDAWYRKAADNMHAARDFLVAGLQPSPVLEVTSPQGGAFVYPRLVPGNGRLFPMETLWERGVPAVGGRSLGGDSRCFRLPFGGDLDALRALTTAVLDWVEQPVAGTDPEGST